MRLANKNIYFADFETTTEKTNKDESNVYLWGIKNLNGKLHWGVKFDKFFSTIIENKIKHIFFHNLKWDGIFIYWYLLEKENFEFVEETKDFIPGKKQFFWICDNSSTIFRMIIKWENDFRTEISCSYQLIKSSVGKLGEMDDLPKLNIDYDRYDIFKDKRSVPKFLVEYLERDIDVVISAYFKIRDHYDLQLTIASTSYKDFKKFYGLKRHAIEFGGKQYNVLTNRYEWKNILTKEQWDDFYTAYFSGYSMYNPKFLGKYIECDGYFMDVVSMYPAVMQNSKLPYSKPLTEKPDGDYTYIAKFFIRKFSPKYDDMPPMFRSSNNKKGKINYINEGEYVELDYTREEWEFLQQYYFIDYEIMEITYFKTKYVYKKWMLKKFKDKENAENEVLRTFYKLIINTNYGKNGEKYYRIKKVFRKLEQDEKVHKGTLTFKNGTMKIDNKYEENEKYSYLPLAIVICAIARTKLFKVNFDNRKTWLYSDTDSSAFLEKPNIENIGFKIGEWEPEARFSKIKIVRAKGYMYTKTHDYDKNKMEWKKLSRPKIIKKVSGINNNKHLINYKNFKKGLIIKDGKIIAKKVKNGVYLKMRDFELRDD